MGCYQMRCCALPVLWLLTVLPVILINMQTVYGGYELLWADKPVHNVKLFPVVYVPTQRCYQTPDGLLTYMDTEDRPCNDVMDDSNWGVKEASQCFQDVKGPLSLPDDPQADALIQEVAEDGLLNVDTNNLIITGGKADCILLQEKNLGIVWLLDMLRDSPSIIVDGKFPDDGSYAYTKVSDMNQHCLLPPLPVIILVTLCLW
eukprot:Lankesteria_metandrocarpae@DN5320_c0_g1_i1.p1